MDVVRWRCLGQAENACWRIETRDRGADRARRFLLRVHRPGYQDARTLPGEAAWLESLRPLFSGRTPAPLRAQGGAYYVLQAAPGVPEPRCVSVLGWVDGRHGYRDKSPARCEALGAFQAGLHQQAQGWRPQGGTRRRDWAWRGLFTDVQTRRIPPRGLSAGVSEHPPDFAGGGGGDRHHGPCAHAPVPVAVMSAAAPRWRAGAPCAPLPALGPAAAAALDGDVNPSMPAAQGTRAQCPTFPFTARGMLLNLSLPMRAPAVRH